MALTKTADIIFNEMDQWQDLQGSSCSQSLDVRLRPPCGSLCAVQLHAPSSKHHSSLHIHKLHIEHQPGCAQTRKGGIV